MDLLRRLLFFDLYQPAVYIALRGLISLSLPIGDEEIEMFFTELDGFLTKHRTVIAVR